MEAPAILPSRLPAALRYELRRNLRSPYEVLICIAANGVLMTLSWCFLPVQLLNLVFSLHGSFAFAVVLASWMFADVPATNVLANDAERTLAVLDQPHLLSQMLYAKNLALWIWAAPICVLINLGNGAVHHDWSTVVVTSFEIVIVPLSSLGVASWVGIWLPYHPITLRDRFGRHSVWTRRNLRWMVVVTLPYTVVPVVIGLINLPAVLLWGHDVKALSIGHLEANILPGVLMTMVLAAGAYIGGHRMGQRFITKRRDQLRAYLSDPSRG